MTSSFKTVLVVGSKGRLGRSLLTALQNGTGICAIGLDRHAYDLQIPNSGVRVLGHLDFDVLVNVAGLTDVDACERNETLAHQVNAQAAIEMARICRRKGARMIQLSTDYVFGGEGRQPLREKDLASPCNVYGQSKLAAERGLQEELPEALIIRTSWLFGGDKPAFPDRVLHKLLRQEPSGAPVDKWAAPTSTDDLVAWITELLNRSALPSGILHLRNEGPGCSWFEYAQAVLEIASECGYSLSSGRIVPVTIDSVKAFLARRPVYTVLDCSRAREDLGLQHRPWREALKSHLCRQFEKQELQYCHKAA
jgi:dTDP-4-dehydrorhamnose reductase